MEIEDLVEKFNILKFKLKNVRCTKYLSESQEFEMFGCTFFQVGLSKLHSSKCDQCHGALTVLYVRFFNRPKSTFKYTIRLSCKVLNISGMLLTSDEGTWHLVKKADNLNYNYNFDVDVEAVLDIAVPDKGPFESLFDDTEPTDFCLNGEDCSVSVHRVILALSSPVLRRMLNGDWKETKEGKIKLHATNKQTLEHLKAFMYSHTIPDTEADLEQLLLLSKIYEMPELERRCVFKLVANMTDETVCYFMALARQHDILRLTWAINFAYQKGALDISKIFKEVL